MIIKHEEVAWTKNLAVQKERSEAKQKGPPSKKEFNGAGDVKKSVQGNRILLAHDSKQAASLVIHFGTLQ